MLPFNDLDEEDFENIVVNGENAGNTRLLYHLFPAMFSTFHREPYPLNSICTKLWPLRAVNVDMSIDCRVVKG